MKNHHISIGLVTRSLISIACLSNLSIPMGVSAMMNQETESPHHLEAKGMSNTASDKSDPLINTAAGLYPKKNSPKDFSAILWITQTNYIGECPGTSLSSPKVRFLSTSVTPAKKLRVEISDGTPSSTKTYQYSKKHKGSEDIRVSKLANLIPTSSTVLIAGDPQQTKTAYYKIFDKRSSEVLEQGKFDFTVRIYIQTFSRNRRQMPVYDYIEVVNEYGWTERKRVLAGYDYTCGLKI